MENGFSESPRSTPIVRNRASMPAFDRIDSDAGESILPLARSGAAPAGSSFKSAELSTPTGQNWGFDDDDEEQLAIGKAPQSQKAKGKKRARDCWEAVLQATGVKSKPLTGERTIHINNQAANSSSGFRNNSVSTSKYNLITFLPKFLFGV